MIKMLDKTQITKEFAEHIVAISIAESGAMGNPGNIIFITDEKELYETNYIYDGKVKEIFKVFSILHQCTDFIFGKNNESPIGWEYTYLGAGNHLFLLEWVDILFYKIVDRNALESDIYAVWVETVMKILDNLSAKKVYSKEKDAYRTTFAIEPYNAQRKEVANKGCIRESLSVKWDSGSNRTEQIVAIGINPSTAQNGESDTTMTKLCRFLDIYGFNNVTMLNLYESVTPNQFEINKKAKTDFSKKTEIFDTADVILLVWGVDGNTEDKESTIPVLAEYAYKLYCIRNPKGKYPAHPSRMSYQSEIMALSSAMNFATCGLKRKKTMKQVEVDEENTVMVECDLGIYFDNKLVLPLGAGMSVVCRFAELADEGIAGAKDIVKSFYCNRDVYIDGKDLLCFIKKEYPDYFEQATAVINNDNSTYKIVCYDLS